MLAVVTLLRGRRRGRRGRGRSGQRGRRPPRGRRQEHLEVVVVDVPVVGEVAVDVDLQLKRHAEGGGSGKLRKDFSSVKHRQECHGYIPQVVEKGFPHPLLACDVSNIDKDLIGWNDPLDGFEKHSLLGDVRSILRGNEPSKPVCLVIISVIFLTSVATINGLAIIDHNENSVIYSISVIPGQCGCE